MASVSRMLGATRREMLSVSSAHQKSASLHSTASCSLERSRWYSPSLTSSFLLMLPCRHCICIPAGVCPTNPPIVRLFVIFTFDGRALPKEPETCKIENSSVMVSLHESSTRVTFRVTLIG